MNRTLGTILFVLGIILIVGGLVIMLVIVPSMKVFPDDVDTTRRYEVMSLRLLNPETQSDFIVFGPGENPDLFVDRHFKTEEVEDDLALVSEERTIYDGEVALLTLQMHHIINRETMMASTDGPEEWHQRPGYWDREGIALSWPIDSEKEDYVGWSDDYRDTVPLLYQDEVEYGGIDTYYFTSESDGRQPIAPAHIETLGLPTVLTMEQVTALANAIADNVEATALAAQEAGEEVDVEAASASAGRIRTLLPRIIEMGVRELEELDDDAEVVVPLNYSYDYFGEYWVEPATGVIIDTHKIEQRYADFSPDLKAFMAETLGAFGGDPAMMETLLPVEVSSYEYIGTDQTVEEARADAEDVLDQLNIYGQILPVGMIVFGAVIMFIGGYGAIREDKPKPDKPEAQPGLSTKR